MIYTLSLRDALPILVGLPDASVQEARERVRAAVRNSGCVFPLRRVTVNLAPADLKKEGPAYDLDRKSTRLNSSHVASSYAVFCLKKKTLRHILMAF